MTKATADQGLLSRFHRVLNYDFCPWANRWVYWMKQPLVGMATVALTAAICGMFVAPQAWLLFAGLLLVAVAGLAWPAATIRGITARVHFDQAWCEEGQTTQIRVTIRNRLPLPAWGISLSGGVPGQEVLVSFSRVNGLSTSQYVWSFTPTQRGVYPEKSICVQSGFPFGVWTARRDVQVDGQLIVFPKPVELDAVPDIGLTGWGDDIYSDRRTGDSGDVAGTRAFRQGDSLRSVHWALSARMSRLICLERQAVLHTSAVVSLDTAGANHGPPGPDSSLEWSIRIFAGICRELSTQGIAVRADLAGESILLQPGQHGMRRLLHRLAHVPRNGTAEVASPSARTSDGNLRIAVLTERSVDFTRGPRIVLLTDGFGAERAPASRFPMESNWREGMSQRIVLHGPTELTSSLKREWRRLCHAIS
ncbi:MAG: DUF58 domain-containing protein [Planctomycetaceae bacterium]|nr:DUF58 domain-containing protein [Planctomycetaceae bacterium]